MNALAKGSNSGESSLSKWLYTLGFVAISLLGFLAIVSGTYDPAIGWIAVSAVPALLLARHLTTTTLSRMPFKRSPLYGPPDRRFSTIALSAIFFCGSYMFTCMFVGSAITVAVGHSQLRRATVNSWTKDYNYSRGRRRSSCIRLGAVIETPEKKYVSFCLNHRYSFTVAAGSAVWLRTYESAFFGHWVEPKAYFPTFDPSQIPANGGGGRREGGGGN